MIPGLNFELQNEIKSTENGINELKENFFLLSVLQRQLKNPNNIVVYINTFGV